MTKNDLSNLAASINSIIETCDDSGLLDTNYISDGAHTFGELYEQRAVLFAVLCKLRPELFWKSLRDPQGALWFDGTGWFLVGCDTPDGSYTYHYEFKYWHLFDCQELDRAKEWDGHTAKDVTRLFSIR